MYDDQNEINLTVYTFGCMKPKVIKTYLVTLKILLSDGTFLEISAYSVPRITGPLPAHANLKESVRTQYRDLNVAPDTVRDQPVDVLVGSDYYYSLVTGRVRVIQNSLFLIESKLGWIVSGQQTKNPENQTMTFLTFVSGSENFRSQFSVPDPPLQDDNIKELWELEAIGIKDSPKVLQQDEIIDFFNKTTTFEEGRYQVKWPWTQYPTDLPLNLGMAIGRLSSLVKRLEAVTLEQYDQVLKDQQRLGVIEEVQCPDKLPSHPVHYLPHHCVVQEGKTTKLRVVYDASAKVRGQHSLNDYLFKGPRMLEDLVQFLILFRMNSTAIVADIEKAFLQVGLQPDDRDVTRFVWLKDVNSSVHPDNLVHYRFKRVPFGIVSSPFLLAATIKHHLSQISTEETKIISNSLYVDNLICSVSSLEQGMSIFRTATSTFEELSMNIREWNSNNPEFMASIPEEKLCSKEIVSVLGLEWNVNGDTLGIAINTDTFDKPVNTKRDTLKIVASVFDPCGFAAPFTLPARILHQELWKDKCKWDDQIPSNRLEEWTKSVEIMKQLKSVTLPRLFTRPTFSTEDGGDLSYQLHCFTDASQDAYAAVTYIRITSGSNHSVTFVMSRSRLTPLRQRNTMTIPKLELLGVLIGVRLVAYIRNTLKLAKVDIYLWTDSQIVLSWIRSNRLLPPFVARRVAEINAVLGIQFRYVTSKMNPADIATRVMTSTDVVPRWTYGPDFLKSPESEWPVWTPDPEKDSSPVSEGTVSSVLIAASTATTDEPASSQPEVATSQSDPIRILQEQHFPREISGATTDLTKSLRCFKDSSGLLRCNAKLQNADLPYDQKFPILLPRDSSFTQEVIRKIHEENYHVGVTHTLTLLRKKYWVPMGRAQVTKVVRSCKPCVKYGGGPYKLPEMPPLPKERVAVCPPFSYTGLDYLGPLTIVEGGSRLKTWCIIFTCMASRAIHLELVPDMSSEEFLLGLRRFVAARGSPLVIVSDNALQFKLTAEVIKSAFCVNNNIQWRFIPELSPWQGGFYERLVGLVKHCLRRTIDKSILSNNQLTTVMKEIECVLNTRPLTVVGVDMEHVLTPSDFLTPISPIVLETPVESDLGTMTATKAALISSWRKSQAAFDQFRAMFTDQYLTSLAERALKPHKQPRVVSNQTPSVGDIVQVKENSVGRVFWRVGQIIELNPSHDGRTRTARVRLSSGNVLTRSISHLYPLEMAKDTILNQAIQPSPVGETHSPDTPPTAVEPVNSPESPETTTTTRPRRKAAEIARERILRMTENLLVLCQVAPR
uniref:Integrase catalytic domain-containing protein n=1 Tax=Cacopsylla melanoneura TaxID=428564 RepID=A0A8D8VU26_9HEMI